MASTEYIYFILVASHSTFGRSKPACIKTSSSSLSSSYSMSPRKSGFFWMWTILKSATTCFIIVEQPSIGDNYIMGNKKYIY